MDASPCLLKNYFVWLPCISLNMELSGKTIRTVTTTGLLSHLIATVRNFCVHNRIINDNTSVMPLLQVNGLCMVCIKYTA